MSEEDKTLFDKVRDVYMETARQLKQAAERLSKQYRPKIEAKKNETPKS